MLFYSLNLRVLQSEDSVPETDIVGVCDFMFTTNSFFITC